MTKRLAVVLNDGFADWEVALLAAGMAEFFGGTPRYATPGGTGVTSIGGLRALGDAAIADLHVEEFDALAVCGSDAWAAVAPLEIDDLLTATVAAGKPLGLICAATLAGARAGLLDARAHTSNGTGWIDEHVPGYGGKEHYVDTPRAVLDGTLVTAPGTAPQSFAREMLTLIYPDRSDEVAHAAAMFAAECEVTGEPAA